MKRLIACALALALLAALLAASAPAHRQEESGTAALAYYLAEGESARGGDAIAPCEVRLDLPEDASLEEKAAALIGRLKEEPGLDGLRSPLPPSAELAGVTAVGQQLRVDFTRGLDQLGGVDLVLADYCLTLSLTGLEGVRSVVITVDGRPVSQQPMQVLYEWDVLLSDENSVLQTVEVTLYFLDETGNLAGERRVLELYEGETLAESLGEALLAGPADRALTALLPKDFQFSSLRLENGVCCIGVPASSLALLPEEEARQRQILWSIADSFYSIPWVSSLRLLSEGEELTRFGAVPTEEIAKRPQG